MTRLSSTAISARVVGELVLGLAAEPSGGAEAVVALVEDLADDGSSTTEATQVIRSWRFAATLQTLTKPRTVGSRSSTEATGPAGFTWESSGQSCRRTAWTRSSTVAIVGPGAVSRPA